MSNYYEQNLTGQPTAQAGPAAGQAPNTANTTAAAPQTGAAADTRVQPPGAAVNGSAAGQQNPVGQAGAAPGNAAWQTPGGNLGQQIGDSVRNMFSKGDWAELKNIGHAVGDTAKEVGNEVKAGFKQHTGQQGHPGQNGAQQPPYVQQANQKYNYSYNYKYNYNGPQNKPAPQRGGQLQTPPWYGKPVASPAQKPTNYAGVGQIVAGGIGIGFFGMMTIPFFASGILAGSVVLGVFAVLSGLLLAGGITKHDYTKRLLAYQSQLMKTNVMTFAELHKTTGYPEAQIRKDFKKGLRKGILKYVYLDKEGETVMLGDNTYNLYLQAEELREQKLREEAERALLMEENPELAQMEAFRTESREVLEKIRKANEAIPGEEISKKLATMEETCAKIFGYVEKHPAKLPDTRKFMSYYLPTTLKVVGKYREYEEMEFQTPSIQKSREEIEQGLDTINEAFSNLLDELYKDDTLDVSTDIEVLQTMLQQEGLTGKKFSIEVDPNMTI